MNILKFTLIPVAILFFFSACEEDQSEVAYTSLGVLKIRNDSAIVDSDYEGYLYIENKSAVVPECQDGDRIAVYFTLVEGEVPPGIDYVIKVYDHKKVLLKDVVEFEEDLADSLGNDPIQVDRIWLIKNFMNLDFSYLGGQISHKINLVHYPDSSTNDTLLVKIHHNANNDAGSIPLSSFVTFDLTPIQPADSIVLRVLSTGFNQKDFDECVTYHKPE